MKGFSKIAFVLMMSLMLLAGCQSQVEEAATVVEAPAETAVPADIPAAPVQQTEEAAEDAVPATELEPAVPAGPVSSSYSYHGYTLDIQAYDGYAIISYPAIVTRSDVDMYLAEISAALPDLASDVTYSFDSDTELRLVYPEGISSEDLRAYSAIFGTGALEAAIALYPSADPYTVEFAYDGYSVSLDIADGTATMAYPAEITSSDMESFFAYENSMTAGAGILSGVYYTIPEDGHAVFTFPETDTRASVVGFAAIAVSDMISFFGV